MESRKRDLRKGRHDRPRRACRAEDIDETAERLEKCSDKTSEPVFHSYPSSMYSDLQRGLQVKYVIDLAAGDGAAALACYKARIVLGRRLSERLEHETLQSMARASDPLFCPQMVTAPATAEAQAPVTPAPKPKPRGRPSKRKRKQSQVG